MNNEPDLLQLKTRDHEVKNPKYQTENYNHAIIWKSLKIDIEYYKKKCKSLNKKKVFIIITEILTGSASNISSSTMGLINPGAGIIISGSTALLTSIAVLITNEYISKKRYIKLRDWINAITLLFENFFKNLWLIKKIDEKEALELKKTYNQYLDKRKDIMKNTGFKVEDVFSDVISKDGFSQEQITKLNIFKPK